MERPKKVLCSFMYTTQLLIYKREFFLIRITRYFSIKYTTSIFHIYSLVGSEERMSLPIPCNFTLTMVPLLVDAYERVVVEQ